MQRYIHKCNVFLFIKKKKFFLKKYFTLFCITVFPLFWRIFHKDMNSSDYFYGNQSNVTSCDIPHTVASWYEFWNCYYYFMQLNLYRGIFGLSLSALATFFNAVVIYLILFNSMSWSLFDDILLGHCIIQGYFLIFLLLKKCTRYHN